MTSPTCQQMPTECALFRRLNIGAAPRAYSATCHAPQLEALARVKEIRRARHPCSERGVIPHSHQPWQLNQANQNSPIAVVRAKTRNSTPPTMPITLSERYFEMKEPPRTAIPVAAQCPTMPPAHTPNGLPAAARAMVASCERSPISAARVSVHASITSGKPPLSAAPETFKIWEASSRSSSIPAPSSSMFSASTSAFTPKKTNETTAT
mmetsp:Transcript_9660/g.21566  ORF Transcript_9660/g.21566 Transcript_9660/m.21566 type:complete len:209 (-) Transcript_9660:522-1148(-)